jgi:hypothetical protein
MRTINWNNKDYPIPFSVNLEWDNGKMIEVQNRFGGSSCELPWFAVAIYDMIMGAERLEAWQDHRDGLDWFIEHFPDAYMVLLD